MRLALITLAFMGACSPNKPSAQNITITGNVPGIPAKKVYLIRSTDFKHFVDSADYDGSKFTFSLPANTERFPASIIYFKPDKKPLKLTYLVKLKSSPNINNGTSTFWIDQGMTTIEGQWEPNATLTSSPLLSIRSGEENELYHKYMRTNFGTNPDKVKIEISEHPDSYYLLKTVLENKERYPAEKVEEIRNEFSKKLLASGYGRSLDVYIQNRYESGQPFRPIGLSTPEGKKVEKLHAGKLNMIVFWASWCGPCRLEIPQLKEIRKKYTADQLNIFSVSVDSSNDEWKKALNEEAMSWPQGIIDFKDFDKVKARYNFTAIPMTVFTDSSGKELKRFQGFEAGQTEKYKSFVESALKENK